MRCDFQHCSKVKKKKPESLSKSRKSLNIHVVPLSETLTNVNYALQ